MIDKPTFSYVDPFSEGHRTEFLAFFMHVSAECGIQLNVHAPQKLWRASSELAGTDSIAAEFVQDLEIRRNTRANKMSVLPEIERTARRHGSSLLFFPLVDEFLFAFSEMILRNRFITLPWSGIYFGDSFSFLGDEICRPMRLFRSLVCLNALRLCTKHGARELSSLNKNWRPAMSVPVTWLPDSLTSLDRMAAQASAEGEWPVPQIDPQPDGRKRFLMFGAMQPRKGLYELLKAMLRLENGELAQIELRLKGKFDEGYRARTFPLIEALRSRGMIIEIEDFYVSEVTLDMSLRWADYVLAPYIDHVGSSGVMGLSAQYGRPLLSQYNYQIGRDVRAYDLGVTANCKDSKKIALELRRLLSGSIVPTAGMDIFRRERAPERTAAVVRGLLGKLLGNQAAGTHTPLPLLVQGRG